MVHGPHHDRSQSPLWTAFIVRNACIRRSPYPAATAQTHPTGVNHMFSSAIRILVGFAAVSMVTLPANVAAQQADREIPGIWIAGADGQLRSVRPVHTSLRSTYSPDRSTATSSVRIVFAVENYARSATGAIAAGELAVARVAAALAAAGVSAADITIEAPLVQARQERRLLAASWEPRRVHGYEAAHLMIVQVPHSARMGLLIDQAVGAGATRVLAVEPGGP
jgi:uncharacterized protein YggE